MKKFLTLIVLVCAMTGVSLPVLAQVQQHKEFAAVDQTMKTMMQAFKAGRADIAFQVFRKDAVVLGYSSKQQKTVTQTGEEWAQGFPGKPADDEAQRHRQYTILDISDTGAVVKVTLDYPQWLGVDYLALNKIDGQWKIVSKSWSGTRK
ncbi:nuclear transport factor 2 family protein [Undibacterium amnicola]|uniref:Nuclear transport factor 2 family protein n=2 Tax=Undibacterium amnicola TaxID=1834038 RepID=A0ABR6XUR8_9BURK|nr:nuclear transport factor 2 family protein [Undibacterium amnicola]